MDMPSDPRPTASPPAPLARCLAALLPARMDEAWVHALAPGIDFFGLDRFALQMALPTATRAIRMSIDSEHEILNLGHVYPMRGGTLRPPRGTLRMSSVYRDDDGAFGTTSLRQGGPIHTNREARPWLELTLAEDEVIDGLRIENRPDLWSIRSDRLQIEIADASAVWRTIYRHHDPALRAMRLAQCLQGLADLAALVGDMAGLEALLQAYPPEAWQQHAAELRVALIGLAESQLAHLHGGALYRVGPPDMRQEEARLVRLARGLLILLRRALPHAPAEATLLGFAMATLCRDAHRVDCAIQNLSPWGDLLARIGAIRRFETAFNAAQHALWRVDDACQYQLTRHGMTQGGLLVSEREAHVAMLAEVCAAIATTGVPVMLCYGTLLGLVREADFIAHDDDIDLLVVHPVRDRAGAQAAQRALAAHLANAGFDIVTIPDSDNFHAGHGDLYIDVFPAWVDAGQLHLYMHEMRIASVPAEIMLPARAVPFLGRMLPVPSDPEALLAARYGADWRTPTHLFELPWPLEMQE